MKFLFLLHSPSHEPHGGGDVLKSGAKVQQKVKKGKGKVKSFASEALFSRLFVIFSAFPHILHHNNVSLRPKTNKKAADMNDCISRLWERRSLHSN